MQKLARDAISLSLEASHKYWLSKIVRTLSNLFYVMSYILNPLFLYKEPTVSVDQVHAGHVTTASKLGQL